jgi:copper transport protein
MPTEYSISPNSITELQKFPSNISILFSERLDPKISHIYIFDANGQRIDEDDFGVSKLNERQAFITVNKSKLADNTAYSVSWFTMSLDDGHTSKGTFVLGVGNMDNFVSSHDDLETETNLPLGIPTSTIDGLLRAPLILSQIFVTGTIVSKIYLFRSFKTVKLNHQFLDAFLTRRLVKLIGIGCIMIVVFSALIILVQTYEIAENKDRLLHVVANIFQTPIGIIWLIRVSTSGIMVFLMLIYYLRLKKIGSKAGINAKRNNSDVLYFMLILCGINLASNSILSHSAALLFLPSIAVIADYIHLFFVSCWIGGLFFLGLVLVWSIRKGKFLMQDKNFGIIGFSGILFLIFARFSMMAILCLGIIAVTGLYLALVHISSPDQFLSSPYGNILFIKLVLASGMITIGAYHQFIVQKGIVKAARSELVDKNSTINMKRDIINRFGFSIRIESLIGIALIVVASVLTTTSPPLIGQINSDKHSNMSQIINTQNSSFVYSTTNSDVKLEFRVVPFQVGFNTFNMSLTNQMNKSIPDISNVYVQFEKDDSNFGPIVEKFVESNERYSSFGGYLSQPGKWDIKVTVQRKNTYDLNYRFSMSLNNSLSNSNSALNMNTDKSVKQEISAYSNLDLSKPFTILFVALTTIIVSFIIVLYINCKRNLKSNVEYFEKNTDN